DAARPVQPALDQLAVAVDELDEAELRVDLAEALEALVAGPRCTDGTRRVQLDHLRAQGPRQPGAAVGRVRIDVDHRQAAPDHRVQAAAEPLPLVPADDHDAQ